MSLTTVLLLALTAQHQHHPGMAMPPAKAKPAAAKPAPRKAVRAQPARRGKAKSPVRAAPRPAVTPPATVDHTTMDHSAHGAPPAPDQPGHDPAPTIDHSAMDHSKMDHGAAPASTVDHAGHGAPVPATETPPPPSAGAGPARAADAVWGPDAMRASRDALRTMHGGQRYFWFQGDRFEARTGGGREGYLWDLQGFYGGDTDRLFFKSEGEGDFGKAPEQAEVQALWSHAIGPWFDLQTGIRQDFAGPDRTHLAIGVQGLAPYQFELDAAAFVSDRGEVSARIEGELDQRITQRLRLQPRAEINLSAQDVPERGIGAGLDEIELGLRLRYEIAREFAPYIGVEQVWRTGAGARYTRAAGDDPSATHFVAGVRFWF